MKYCIKRKAQQKKKNFQKTRLILMSNRLIARFDSDKPIYVFFVLFNSSLFDLSEL